MFLKRCSSPVLSGAELLGCPEEGPAGGSKGTSWPVAPICTPGRSGDSAILAASRFLDDGDDGLSVIESHEVPAADHLEIGDDDRGANVDDDDVILYMTL